MPPYSYTNAVLLVVVLPEVGESEPAVEPTKLDVKLGPEGHRDLLEGAQVQEIQAQVDWGSTLVRVN